MKHLFILIPLISALNISFADLSIQATLSNTWTITDPIISEWSDFGSPQDCITTENSINCSQNQIRNVQNQQIDLSTNKIRNLGYPLVQFQTIKTSSDIIKHEPLINNISEQSNEVCKYSNKSNHVWKGFDDSKVLYVWDNVFIGSTSSDSILINGSYSYKANTLKDTSVTQYLTSHYYEICRTPILT